MRLYDLVLIIKSSLTEKERTKVLDTIKGWLKDAKIAKEESWGQKPLAYTIKRELSGVYHVLQLESEKGLPQDLEKKIQASEQVLRHLLIRRK